MSPLRCPRCHAPLRANGADLDCVGPGCGLRFPIVDGVPVLVDEQASVFRISDYTSRTLRRPPQSRLHALALRLLPSLDLNVAARENVQRLRSLLFARSSRPEILNIGGKHPRAAMATLRKDSAIAVTECDVVPGPGVTLLADPRALPFAAASFDAVLLDGVLEHSVDPQGVADEVHRVLRPGGLGYADTPFMLPVHGGAHDFGRFSALAHRRLFARFQEVAAGVSSGPAAALGYAVQSLLLAFASGRRSRFAIKALCRLGLFWLKYLDLAIAARPGALDGALGVFFLGERAEAAIGDRELSRGYAGNTPDLYARAARPTLATNPTAASPVRPR